MNIKQASDLIKLSIKADVPALLIGHSGTGKSEVVNQIGQALGYKVVTKMLSQVEIGDLGGVPFRDPKDNKMYHAKPFWIPDNEPIILFLDELNQCQRDVESAAFDLVLNREVNGHKLPKGSRVIAAINPNTQEYTTTNQISSALVKRFIVIPFEPTVGEFVQWGRDTGKIEKSLLDFVHSDNAALGLKELDIQMTIEPCSRTLRMASQLFFAGIESNPNFLEDTNLVTNILKGTIGTSNAAKYLAFQKSQEKPLTFKQLLDFEKFKEKFIKAQEDIRGDIVSVTIKNFSEGIEDYVQSIKGDFEYTEYVSDVDAVDKDKAATALKQLKKNVKENLDTKKVGNLIEFLKVIPDDQFFTVSKRFLEYLPVQKGMTSEEATAALNAHHTLINYIWNDNCNENNVWDRVEKGAESIKTFLKAIDEEKKKDGK